MKRRSFLLSLKTADFLVVFSHHKGEKMNRFSIHTGNCPDDCTHHWSGADIIETFDVSLSDIENLEVGDIFEINEELNLMRDA